MVQRQLRFMVTISIGNEYLSIFIEPMVGLNLNLSLPSALTRLPLTNLHLIVPVSLIMRLG